MEKGDRVQAKVLLFILNRHKCAVVKTIAATRCDHIDENLRCPKWTGFH